MRKPIVAIFVFAALCFLSACSCGKKVEIPDAETAEKFSGTAEYVALSEVKDGKIAAYIFMDEILKCEDYYYEKEGETKTTALILHVTQKISSRRIKRGNEYYVFDKSESSFMNTFHQALFSLGAVAYRDGEKDKIIKADVESYRAEYGVTPEMRTIEGFIVNEKTVLSSEISEKEDGSFEINLELDGNLGGYFVRTQMKKSGGLDDYPEFESVYITLCLNSDYFPIKTVIKSKYTAKKIFNNDCEQTLTAVYKKEKAEIPDYSELRGVLYS